MITRRLTPVAALLAAVLVMGTGAAKAETVRIAVRDTVSVNVHTDFVALTGVIEGELSFSGQCMKDHGFASEHPVIKAVIIDSDNPPGLVDQVILPATLQPGTRLGQFELVATCVEGGTSYNVFDATVISPKNVDIALVTTPAGVTLVEDHEGVVGGGTDEFGIADAVCVKKGSQSIKTPLISDIPLEAGDRLIDFLEIDFDPDTGETTYACWLEY